MEEGLAIPLVAEGWSQNNSEHAGCGVLVIPGLRRLLVSVENECRELSGRPTSSQCHGSRVCEVFSQTRSTIALAEGMDQPQEWNPLWLGECLHGLLRAFSTPSGGEFKPLAPSHTVSYNKPSLLEWLLSEL